MIWIIKEVKEFSRQKGGERENQTQEQCVPKHREEYKVGSENAETFGGFGEEAGWGLRGLTSYT